MLRAESHAPDAIGTMSLSALKSLIEEAGLSHADCLDEADLSARARGALTAGAIKRLHRVRLAGGSDGQFAADGAEVDLVLHPSGYQAS